MERQPGGEAAGGDRLLLAGCLALALIALALPRPWAVGFARVARETALRPLVILQTRASLDRIARTGMDHLQHERDSLALQVQRDASIRRENLDLRALLGLRGQLRQPFRSAEVMHRTAVTDARMLLLTVGTADSVGRWDPVVASNGLLGYIESAGRHASSVLTWLHPDFRASAVTEDGAVLGFVVPSITTEASRTVLEFRGVALRDSLPIGTVVVTAGIGGVYPHGIPIGRISAVGKDSLGYERIYRVLPFANPGDVTQALVLVAPHDSLFPGLRPDSLP